MTWTELLCFTRLYILLHASTPTHTPTHPPTHPHTHPLTHTHTQAVAKISDLAIKSHYTCASLHKLIAGCPPTLGLGGLGGGYAKGLLRKNSGRRHGSLVPRLLFILWVRKIRSGNETRGMGA